MKTDDTPQAPDAQSIERRRRSDTRRALVFGVVMATIQMGILLYFAYC